MGYTLETGPRPFGAWPINQPVGNITMATTKKKPKKNEPVPDLTLHMVTGRVVGIDVWWCPQGKGKKAIKASLDVSQANALMWTYKDGTMTSPDSPANTNSPPKGTRQKCTPSMRAPTDTFCWWDGKNWHCPPAP